MTDAVLWETDGPVAIITMNRPERRNALSRAVREGIRARFEAFEADPALRVAILTGAGDAFCAGLDLKEAAEEGMTLPPRGPGGLPIIGEDLVVTKPTIAAVNGAAFAGGWLMAQMCDLCVAAETAVFAITEARVGRGTPWAAPLAAMLPERIVMELLLTGAPVPAPRLHALGYVNRVVPREEVRAAALEMARAIAANAPLTVAACRELVRLSRDMGCAAARKVGDELFRPVYLSEDAQEGPRAFAEKRPPVWKGR